MLTPVDLETTVFSRGLRGYKVREVQDFMARVTRDYEHLYREHIDLQEKLEACEAKLATYQRTEEMLHSALILAEQTAGEVRQAGQKQADLMVREAEHRAEQVRARVKEEIRAELERLAALRQRTEFFRLQFKNFLAGLADLADRQLNLDEVWEGLFKGSGAGDDGPPNGGTA